jgi:hypothetical protein
MQQEITVEKLRMQAHLERKLEELEKRLELLEEVEKERREAMEGFL